jgi:hypothetical protein
MDVPFYSIIFLDDVLDGVAMGIARGVLSYLCQEPLPGGVGSLTNHKQSRLNFRSHAAVEHIATAVHTWMWWGRILFLWFCSATSVVLRGRLPASVPLRNISTIHPMNRIKESSLAQIGAQLAVFQIPYSVDNTTALLPLEIAFSLSNISCDDEIGVLFGRRVERPDGQPPEIHIQGVCEFEFPKSLFEFERIVSQLIPSVSRISSLEPVGCFFPKPSPRISAPEVAAAMLLSGSSRHPTDFILVRYCVNPSLPADPFCLLHHRHEQQPPAPPIQKKFTTHRRSSLPTERSLGLSALRIHPLAFSLHKERLLDLSRLVGSTSSGSALLRTTREVSINDGEPVRELDSVLLTVPTAVSQPSRPAALFSPVHIFPPPHRIRGSLPRATKDYLSHLLALSQRSGKGQSPAEELSRWFDLNLLLKLREEVDETVLTRLVDLLRRDALRPQELGPSSEFRFLIDSLKTYVS